MNKSVLRQADIRNPLLPGKSGYQICEEIQVQDLRILAGWDRNIRKCCKFGWNRTYTDKKGPQYPGLA